MKDAINILGFLFASMFLFSCNGEPTPPIIEYDDEEFEGLDEFEAFNLRPYDIDALIYLPGVAANIGAATDPEVLHEMDGYEWEIRVGSNFSLIIEDWGDIDAFNEKLEELENQELYDVEFIKKDENFAYYKTELKVRGDGDNDEVGVDHVNYYVIAQYNIEGVNYVFKTNEEGHPKPITDYMAISVKSVQPMIAS